MNEMILSVAVLVASSVLAWALIQSGEPITAAVLFAIGVWSACSIIAPRSEPLFQSSIQITKNTASEAEKETP